MTRADEARKYLSERMAHFVGFKNMADSKLSFFDSIISFKNTIIPGLKKYRIFQENDIAELDRLLSEMEKDRNKGGGDQRVYLASWIGFGKIQTKINELISFTTNASIPWRYNVKDFLFSRNFMIPFICVLLAAIIQLIFHFFIFP